MVRNKFMSILILFTNDKSLNDSILIKIKKQISFVVSNSKQKSKLFMTFNNQMIVLDFNQLIEKAGESKSIEVEESELIELCTVKDRIKWVQFNKAMTHFVLYVENKVIKYSIDDQKITIVKEFSGFYSNILHVIFSENLEYMVT